MRSFLFDFTDVTLALEDDKSRSRRPDWRLLDDKGKDTGNSEAANEVGGEKRRRGWCSCPEKRKRGEMLLAGAEGFRSWTEDSTSLTMALGLPQERSRSDCLKVRCSTENFVLENFLSWKIILWGVQQKLFLSPKYHHQGGGGGEEGDGELRMGERIVLTNCQREERFICLFVCLFVARSADEEEADTSAQRTAKHNLRYSIPLSAAQ